MTNHYEIRDEDGCKYDLSGDWIDLDGDTATVTNDGKLVGHVRNLASAIVHDAATTARYEREDAEARQDDPDEALGALIWRVVDDSDDESSYVTKAVAEEIGRAAREHIEQEKSRMAIKHETETPTREHGECCEPAPADVDPDEALVDEMVDVIFGDGALSHEGLIEARREIAVNAIRVAREHVAATDWHGIRSRDRRAEKAEAELADERDRHNATLIELKRLTTALADMTRQRDEWQARHAALRADVERYVSEMGRVRTAELVSLRGVHLRLVDALDRDDKRGEQA